MVGLIRGLFGREKYHGGMSYRRPLAILAVCLALPLASCAATVELPHSGPLALYPTPNFGMDARLEGTLMVVDGCVSIEVADGTRYVPVFPASDASWEDNALSFGDARFGPGDAITLGGGLSYDGQGSAYIPDACTGLDAWLVSPLRLQ